MPEENVEENVEVSPEHKRQKFPWKSVVGGVLLLGLGTGVVLAEPAVRNAVGSASARAEAGDFNAPTAEVPSADTILSCVATPQLAAGGGSTDSQFAPDTTKQTTGISASVLSDAAARIPGISVTSIAEQKTGGNNEPGTNQQAAPKNLTKRIPDEQASQVLSSGADGTTNIIAKSVADKEATFAKLAVQSLGNQPSLVSAQRTTLSADGDLAGFSSAPCVAPSHDQWLVGASTAVENTAILTISNPTTSAATVTVRAYGSTDQEPNVGTLDRLVIGPGEQYSTLLGGIAPDDPALTLRVQSQGGAVSASIQQSTLRGLTPAGIDYVMSGARLANTAVIPFVWVQPTADSTSLGAGTDDKNSASQLMITVPGSADAKVTATATGADGKSHKIPVPSTLKAGRTAAVSLAELPAGSYSVRVISDRSVVSSARSVRGKVATAPHDAAFTPTAQRLSQRQLVTLPAGGKPYVLFSTDDAAAKVSLRTLGADGKLGKAINYDVAANGTLLVDPSAFGSAGSLLLDTSGGAVYGGGLSFEGTTGITTFAIQPSTNGTQGIPVDIP